MKASIGDSTSDTTIRSSVLWLLENYSSIGYPLNREELVQLLDQPVDDLRLENILVELLKSEAICCDHIHNWYAPQARKYVFDLRLQRDTVTQKKLASTSKIFNILISFPWIRAIVLTGSCALHNAAEQDDIDLMLFVSPNSLFICRLYATVTMWVLGVKRKRGLSVDPDKVCMNVWLEANNMSVPTQKRTTYSAREILKAKVLVDKEHMWKAFLGNNTWIMQKLPNVTIFSSPTFEQVQPSKKGVILSLINRLFGSLQMTYMKPHITNEIVSENQLWLHPQVRS